MPAYYELIGREPFNEGMSIAHYLSTIHAQGTWNTHEQHMAPATGLLCTELERFNPRSNLRIGRLSLDIYGLIHFDDFSIQTRILRPEKTIELLESSMHSQGQTCIVACAWRILTQDLTAVAGIEDARIIQPDHLLDWHGMSYWPGGFIQSVRTKMDPNTNAQVKALSGSIQMSASSINNLVPILNT